LRTLHCQNKCNLDTKLVTLSYYY